MNREMNDAKIELFSSSLDAMMGYTVYNDNLVC